MSTYLSLELLSEKFSLNLPTENPSVFAVAPDKWDRWEIDEAGETKKRKRHSLIEI